jgi:hypothetical protein
MNTATGNLCQTTPDHGKTYVQPDGREYCPHAAHDAKRGKKGTAAFFGKPKKK